MGLNPMLSRPRTGKVSSSIAGPSASSFDESSFIENNDNSIMPANPDPLKYEILEHILLGNKLIIKINYIGCTNYEGNKILMYENCTLNQLKNQKYIDPHFSESTKFISPIARFEPTQRGWNMACELAKMIY